MARKKPSRRAGARKVARKAAPRKKAAAKKKAAARTRAAKPAKRSKRAAKPARPAPKRASAAAKKTAPKAARPAAKAKPAAKVAARPARKPNLDRPRKTVADIHGLPSSLDQGSLASAARSGRSEMKHKLESHTSTSPALTAGDVDADWESAASTGDEAPGGDNPTPDQDVVDEIGRALGVEYGDEEELQGGDEITDRDRHRWELDPASKDDFEEE